MFQLFLLFIQHFASAIYIPEEYKTEAPIETFPVIQENLRHPELNIDHCGSFLRISINVNIAFNAPTDNRFRLKYIYVDARREYLLSKGYSDYAIYTLDAFVPWTVNQIDVFNTMTEAKAFLWGSHNYTIGRNMRKAAFLKEYGQTPVFVWL